MAGFLDIESGDSLLLESGDGLLLEETAFTVATRTATNGSAGTSHTVTLPDGSNVSGVLVEIGFSCDGGTVSWPAGWTEQTDNTATGVTLATAYRFIDGTEGFDGTDDSITVTTSASTQSNYHAYLISAGHHTSTPPEAATAAPGTPDPPSLDPTGWATELALWIAFSASRFAGSYTAAPSNYEGLLSLNGGDTNAPLGSARRELNASSEDPGVFTEDSGSGTYVTALVAVRPAGTGLDVAADTATLALVGVDPVAAGTGTATVTVDVATLTLTGVTPTANGTGTATATADTATLVLSGVDASLTGSGTASRTADVATLVLSGVDVEAATAGSSVTVDTATLTLTGVTPTAAGTGSAPVAVDPAQLVLVGINLAAAGTGTATVTADPATLALVGVDPILAGTGTAIRALDSGVLVLSGVDVTAVAFTVVLVGIAVSVTERSAAAVTEPRGISVTENHRVSVTEPRGISVTENEHLVEV